MSKVALCGTLAIDPVSGCGGPDISELIEERMLVDAPYYVEVPLDDDTVHTIDFTALPGKFASNLGTAFLMMKIVGLPVLALFNGEDDQSKGTSVDPIHIGYYRTTPLQSVGLKRTPAAAGTRVRIWAGSKP